MLSTELATASILAVDDNALILSVLKSVLAREHYQVFAAANGLEALKILDSKIIDLIICDVMMPQMDGYQFHKLVRENPEHSHIPFIFLTALSEENEVRTGIESGADEYLLKPFDPERLLCVVKGKLTRSRGLKELGEQRYDTYRKRVIHTLSHEFRTPLVAINTGAELLLDQHDKGVNDKVRNLLEAIHRGGQRLERLVTDFMVLQQIEAGVAERLYNSRSAVQKLGESVKVCIESFCNYYKPGTRIEFKDLSQDACVKIYGAQFEDALHRVLDNAVKFSAQGSLINAVLYKRENELVLEVRDRGIGLNTEKVREAVDVFGQIDRDKMEQQGGGLGLAIANRYLKLHAGHLEFEQRQGGGAVVSLVLPLWQA